jgi:tetratricopeptide (TPR) repeat protein
VRRKEYAAAAVAYESALALNPLYPDVWFSLGYCYLRLEQNQKALQVRSCAVCLRVVCRALQFDCSLCFV